MTSSVKWAGIIIVLFAAAFEIDKMLALPLVNSARFFISVPEVFATTTYSHFWPGGFPYTIYSSF